MQCFATRTCAAFCARSNGPALESGFDAVVRISGPLALFRRTIVYGRALASLIPTLAWCDAFSVRAFCVIGPETIPVAIESGDPIFPSREPKRYDSAVERRFARELARAAPDWELVREPEPVAVGRRFLFPDFAIYHRRDPARRWLLEIVDFWTPDYLEHKLSNLRRAGLERLILCIDADRNCADEDLPRGARVIRFRRRLDPAEVLRVIEEARDAATRRRLLPSSGPAQ